MQRLASHAEASFSGRGHQQLRLGTARRGTRSETFLRAGSELHMSSQQQQAAPAPKQVAPKHVREKLRSIRLRTSQPSAAAVTQLLGDLRQAELELFQADTSCNVRRPARREQLPPVPLQPPEIDEPIPVQPRNYSGEQGLAQARGYPW